MCPSYPFGTSQPAWAHSSLGNARGIRVTRSTEHVLLSATICITDVNVPLAQVNQMTKLKGGQSKGRKIDSSAFQENLQGYMERGKDEELKLNLLNACIFVLINLCPSTCLSPGRVLQGTLGYQLCNFCKLPPDSPLFLRKGFYGFFFSLIQ